MKVKGQIVGQLRDELMALGEHHSFVNTNECLGWWPLGALVVFALKQKKV